MALPPAIRVLAAATICVFCFLIFQIFRAPSNLTLPGDNTKMNDMVRDPNLDGMHYAVLTHAFSHTSLRTLSQNRYPPAQSLFLSLMLLHNIHLLLHLLMYLQY